MRTKQELGQSQSEFSFFSIDSIPHTIKSELVINLFIKKWDLF